MSSINTEQPMPEDLAKAIANPLFPALDSALRAGRHIASDDLDNHALLIEFEQALNVFYQRYNAELVRAPEGFFYLRPRSTSLIRRSVLSELDMLVGKVLCFFVFEPRALSARRDLYHTRAIRRADGIGRREKADEAGYPSCYRLRSRPREAIR